MNPLLTMVYEIQAHIRSVEGDFAALNLADFKEGYNALVTVPEQIRYCMSWLRMYTNENSAHYGGRKPHC